MGGLVSRFAAVLLALLASVACGPDEQGDGPPVDGEVLTEAAPARPNIVLYLIDTLRQNHLGLYGYERSTSPHLDALAADAITFTNATATSSWTKATTASLLTGQYPSRHGASSRNSRVSPDSRLLSEYLKPLGYYQAGVVTNPFVVGHWGFDRAYDEFHDLGADLKGPTDWQEIDAKNVNRKAFEILDARPSDQPFLLYLHTIDVHGPNAPRAPFDKLFTDTPRPPGLPGRLNALSKKKRVEEVIDLYDGEIAYADEQFGAFIAGLKERGLYEDTVIWFVSDHGEEFLDHGRGGHGTQLFDEVVKVPMMLKLPGGLHGGTRVEGPVSQIDLVTTQLSILGERPPEALAGVDLRTLVGAPWEQRPLFMDLNLVAGTEQTLYISSGLVLGRYKYFEEVLPEPEKYLFDMQADPDERNNLYDTEQETAQSMVTLLQAHRASELSGLVLTGVGDKSESASVLEARLSTDGLFVGVDGIDLEEGDLATIGSGGSTADVRLQLAAYKTNIGFKPWQQDFDTVVLRLDPPDAMVTLNSLTLNGEPAGPVYLGLSRTAQEVPLTSSAGLPELAVPELSAMFTEAERNPLARANELSVPAGLYLVILPDFSADLADIPDEMMDRLRALGYVK
ncbi:MAG: arylsulfatase A-like enzyme [Pseudohongiellaceae bacterium]